MDISYTDHTDEFRNIDDNTINTMNLLYKDRKDIIYKVEIKHHKDEGNVHLLFFSDCGKHGTDEILDEYDLTPLQLLKILQKYELEKL